MLKDGTLLRISYRTCPTIYVNKPLLRLTYGRAPTRESNPVVTQNRRIGVNLLFLLKIPNVLIKKKRHFFKFYYFYFLTFYNNNYLSDYVLIPNDIYVRAYKSMLNANFSY